jgi:hypothetical protein
VPELGDEVMEGEGEEIHLLISSSYAIVPSSAIIHHTHTYLPRKRPTLTTRLRQLETLKELKELKDDS